jgi:hypothetical protein
LSKRIWRMRTSPEGCADVLIRSIDLDWTKFSCQNVLRMRELFPEAGDETVARYLTARGDDLQKVDICSEGRGKYAVCSMQCGMVW